VVFSGPEVERLRTRGKYASLVVTDGTTAPVTVRLCDGRGVKSNRTAGVAGGLGRWGMVLRSRGGCNSRCALGLTKMDGSELSTPTTKILTSLRCNRTRTVVRCEEKLFCDLRELIRHVCHSRVRSLTSIHRRSRMDQSSEHKSD
jgi:hypothetical protein